MKKIIVLISIFVLILLLVGCDSIQPSTDDTTPNSPETSKLATEQTGDSNSHETDTHCNGNSDINTPEGTENSVGEIEGESFNPAVEISEDDTNTLSEIFDTDIRKEEPTDCESYGTYAEFMTDIYLCDDVYRTKDTPTHGSGLIALSMGQDIFEVKDYKILLCVDECDHIAIVSRASQGYAPVYSVVLDGKMDGNFKTYKFKMAIPEPMAEDLKNHGDYENIMEQLESNYHYLLVIDENHYAYIHLKAKDGDEKIENEAELADSIIKKAEINLNFDIEE